jgi:glyoxylase-like metal-dependent hydrolase (beta-lactamase superfamily II)
MKLKSHAAGRLFLSLLLALPPTAAFGAQQPANASQKSYQRARGVLDAGIQALGGLEALRAIQDFTLKEVGKDHFSLQDLRADPPFGSAPREETTVVDTRRGRLFNEVKNLFPGLSNWVRTVIDGGEGYTLDMRSKTATPINNPSVAGFRTQFRRLPNFLLLEALDGAANLRWVGEDDFRGRRQNVISFVRDGGRQVSLYFDARTNLLTKFDYVYTDGAVGDSIVEQIYPGYRDLGGIKVPAGRALYNAGFIVEETEYREVQLNSRPAENLFDLSIPPGFEKLPAPPAQPETGVTKLADDVYLLRGDTHNSLFVAFNDYVLVVDAPEPFPYRATSEGIIAKVKETVPGKPIRYVALTHHHADHAGGARAFIAEGVAVITTPGNKSFVERVAAAPFTVVRDALARRPRPVVFEIIEGKKRVLRDDRHVVELHDVGPSPHADEMVVAYLPQEKILFQSDLVNPDAGGTRPFASDGAVHLAGKMLQLGWDVERIAGGHGRVVTLDELRAALEKRRLADERR